MKNILMGLALVIAPGFASAADLSLNAPLEGATLSDGTVDMSVYFADLEAGYEVVATYVTQDAATPAQFVMVLNDGDSVSFGLPGVAGQVYTFSRVEDTLNVDAAHTWTQIAAK